MEDVMSGFSNKCTRASGIGCAGIRMPTVFLLTFKIFGTLELLNRKVSDILMSLYPNHHSFSEEIVILDIDEHSLAYYADHPLVGRWPWKRSIYPSMYAYLNMAGAKLIINDMLFTEHSPEDDSIVIANQTFPEISHSVSFRDNVTQDKNSFDLSKWGKFSTEIDGQFKINRLQQFSCGQKLHSYSL